MMIKSVTYLEPDFALGAASGYAVSKEAGFVVARPAAAHVFHRPEDVSSLDPSATGRLRINSSDLIITEAPLLSEAERGDALEALVADGIFESQDWTSWHLPNANSGSEGTRYPLEESALVLAGIKFGWAIEQAARIAKAAVNSSLGIERFEIALEAPDPVSPGEHEFIGRELQRRGVQGFDLMLPWGGRWEPAVEWIGELEAFDSGLLTHSEIAAQNRWRLGFDHAEQKFTVLPILRARCGDHVHLNVDGLGWIEVTRIIARHEPSLLRRLLPVAQDRFAFDKPNAEFATTEDDIRSLPDVPDAELERVFVDDFRGRQLLRFTASSLLKHEDIGPAIRDTVERHRAEHDELVAAEVRRHLAAWANEGKAEN